MDIPHIGLFAYKQVIRFEDLVALARALQQQMVHVQSCWGPQATAIVSAFPDMDHPHPEVWPIVISADINSTDSGYHLTQTPKPQAYVLANQFYTIMTSHECVEMVVDPWGNTRKRGTRPDRLTAVEYLVEACDPCVSPNDAYSIGDIWVSDFVTPDYYAPRPNANRFSYAERIASPEQVNPYGYVTWFDPALGRWSQKKADANGNVAYFDLGAPDLSQLPARMAVDRVQPGHDFSGLVFDTDQRKQARADHERAATRAGDLLKADLQRHLSGKRRSPRAAKLRPRKLSVEPAA